MSTPRGRLWTANDRARSHADLDRCWKVVRALASLPCDSRLTEKQQTMVVHIVEREGCTRSDFTMLDEKPGHFGYSIDVDGTPTEWHWKLRQTRNTPGNRLFEVLT